MERKCSNCKEVKSLEEFFKDSSKALGRSYWCKVCNATYSKAHYNYIKVRPVRTIIPKPCAQCGETMTKSSLESYNSWMQRILCSRTCKFIYRKGKGTKPRIRRNCTPEEKARRKELIDFTGEKNPFYGKTHTEETKKKVSSSKQGISIDEWQEFAGTESRRQRVQFREKLQKLIFKRDGYKCQICSSKQDLQVDHIQRWSEFKELRFDPDNCRTLCAKCHYKITFGREMPASAKGWGNGMIKRMVD